MDATKNPGIIISPNPIKNASRSSSSLSFSFKLFVSLIREYFLIFGITSIIGNLRSKTVSARSIICLVLYTDIASYIANPMSKTITKKILNEIPNVAIAPTPTIMPHMSITYHSGYLTSVINRIAAAVMERNNDHTSGTTIANKG